ncbi:MAG: COX15/CtaA family protein [Chloroflexi bacterium]|nr:COX15/CtaA family protein [Chloroflexota bacterium]
MILVGVGVLVRATGSGLGCPDWPTCQGGALPPGDRNALIEFSHRFTASIVGLMVIATAIMAWRHYRDRPFTVYAATIAVPLVVIQGLLGALTVVRELPPAVVATHLLTAMLVLSVEIAVFVSMYFEDPGHARYVARALDSSRQRIGQFALVALGWLAATMWIGGYMTESGASTACSGWPTCNGSVLPGNDDQEITHMVHRYLAGALIFLLIPVLLTAWRRRRQLPWAGTVAIVGAALYLAQVLVGALNVWYTFPDALAVTHTVLASGVWITLVTTVILSYYSPVGERRSRALPGVEVAA